MRILFATPKFIWLNCFFYFRCEDSSLARHLLQHLLPWHCPSSKSFAGCVIKLQTLISNLPWAKKRTGNLTRAWRRWQSRGSMELPSCFLPLWVGAHFRRSLVVLFVSQTGEITPQQATPTWSHLSFWPSWHPCTFFQGKSIDKESCQDGRTRHSQLFHQLDPLLCVCYDISHRWLRNFWQRPVFHPWNIRQGQPHVQPAALHAYLQAVRKGKRMRWSACYENNSWSL